MSKHTPGPWKACGFKNLGVNTDNGNGFTVSLHPGRDIEEAQANARLIAAAPELLEKMVEITNVLAITWTDDDEFVPHDEDYDRTCDPNDPQGCLICECRAVIAKAKGE